MSRPGQLCGSPICRNRFGKENFVGKLRRTDRLAPQMEKVKIIHVIKRLEALDRDISELRQLTQNLDRDRGYYSELSIAFDKQINKLLNERTKLMELKIENPPENLVGQKWKEEEVHAWKNPANRELKSPPADGPVLNQDQADQTIARIKDQLARKKKPSLVIKSSEEAAASGRSAGAARSPEKSASSARERALNFGESSSQEPDDDAGLRTHKF